MMIFKRRKDAAPEPSAGPVHSVHFYEQDEALIARLEEYVVEGARLGQTTVVIATPLHRQMLRERLSQWELEEAFLGLDAQDCLNRFMVAGLPDPQLFELTIGALVRSRAEEGVRAYGEMVSLLWQQDNLAGTLELETLWNGLQRETDFALMCAYPLQDVEGRPGLADVCDLHSEVLPLAS